MEALLGVLALVFGAALGAVVTALLLKSRFAAEALRLRAEAEAQLAQARSGESALVERLRGAVAQAQTLRAELDGLRLAATESAALLRQETGRRAQRRGIRSPRARPGGPPCGIRGRAFGPQGARGRFGRPHGGGAQGRE